jgi:AcrR family transcriptional regulator
MFDQSTLRGRVAAAALRLASERPWSDVTLLDIAEAAGCTLGELRREAISGKGDVLAALTRAIDDEVLAKAPKRAAGTSARDAIFEIVMSRLDALAPHKPALRSIFKEVTTDLRHARGVLASQRWMLEAAGVATDGVTGAMKVAGLASVYASVFRVWLEDDDPGLARTMAALDRRLRRGESTMQSIDSLLAGIGRLTGLFTGATKPAPKPDAPA